VEACLFLKEATIEFDFFMRFVFVMRNAGKFSTVALSEENECEEDD
jgi:hypothetical protein